MNWRSLLERAFRSKRTPGFGASKAVEAVDQQMREQDRAPHASGGRQAQLLRALDEQASDCP